MGVVRRVALAYGEHDLVEGHGHAVAQLRDHPRGRIADRALGRHLLLGLPDLGGLMAVM